MRVPILSRSLKNAVYIILPVCIAYYLFSPLLSGKYLYPLAEYELYKSFMINFIDTLKGGNLPVWNEYVGGGHPAMYFGHYPISQNTIFYMLFGFNDYTYYFTKFLGTAILLYTFIYACRYLGFNYFVALIGALIYFSVNFVIRIIVAETIGNLLFLYPLLVILMIKIIDENKTKDILIFNLCHIFWLLGGHIVYVYMHLIMLTLVYCIAILVFYERSAFKAGGLRKVFLLYFILFVIPFLAALYQYYFVYDVISASNRLKEGLIVSPLDLTVWKQFIASLKSSAYFWIGIALILFHGIIKLFSSRDGLKQIKIRITPAALIFLSIALIYITAQNIQFNSNSNFISDIIPMLNSMVFRLSLLLYITVHLRSRYNFFLRLNDVFVFIIFVLLLSYYFYSPENIIGDVQGYDYDLFRELSVPLQIMFTFLVLFSAKDYKKNKIIKIIAISSIALYFLRSHFTIPLLRFTGIVWYATRDGSIFSLFFAILFMLGFKNLILELSNVFKDKGNVFARNAQYVSLVLVLVLLVHDSYNKLYKGTSHRFIYPNQMNLAGIPMEKFVINGRKEMGSLINRLLSLNEESKYFYRNFTPENSYLYLGGSLQHHKIYDAAIYDSSISREFQDFYDYTILGKNPERSRELKDIMPYFLFTRHVHAGLNLDYKKIAYGDFFMFSPKTDAQYLKNQNIEFLWDLMQVKYVIAGPEFSKILEDFTTKKYYELIAKFPALNLNLYEILRAKNYSRMAVLPLKNTHDSADMVKQLNSSDISKLKELYSRLIFLDQNSANFQVIKSQNYYGGKYYEIDSKQSGILIDFESWNRNWSLKVNDKGERLQKAFQLFKGIKIEQGINKIELTYNVKYFKELFLLSFFIIFMHLILLGRHYYREAVTK